MWFGKSDLRVDGIPLRLAALCQTGASEEVNAAFRCMDQAKIKVLWVETEETALVDCQVANGDGCERGPCLAPGDVLKRLVVLIEKPDDPLGLAKCLV